MLLNLTKGLKI